MQSALETPTKVCGIVVTYQPVGHSVENVRLLSGQFSKIVVVDNGSRAECATTLSDIETIPGVTLIRNPANLGIAAALNQGILHAQSLGFDWIATFDQDSSITPNYVRTMLAAYEACPFRNKVALICPTPCETENEWNKKKDAARLRPYSPVLVAMTSGSIIKAQVFGEAGLYDEKMFIDYVDFEFCLRLRQKGYFSIQSRQTCLLHRLGTSETNSFMGIPVSIKSHNAVRYYYIMRNRIVMYRRFATRFPLWVAHDLLWLCLDLIKILFLEQDKTAKLRNAARGFHDGIMGVLGPISPPAR